MRLKLEFDINNNSLPCDYRRCFVSFIKKALTISNEGKYYEDFYKDTKEKPFTFTIMFRSPKFKDNKVFFEDNKVVMYFSILDYKREALIMCNCLLKMKNSKFMLPEGNFMTLINVRKINEKNICTNTAIFRTIGGSSIILRDHNKETNIDKYYTVEDDFYKEKLEAKIKDQCLSAGFSKEEVNKLTIKNINGKKIVIKNYGVYIDGVKGTFEIEADSDILQYLYTVGFGSRRSLGFSFVDIL